MTLTPEQIVKTDKQRMEGASAEDVLGAYTEAFGDRAPELFKQYANSRLPDGRKRSQVNLGDPAEWS